MADIIKELNKLIDSMTDLTEVQIKTRSKGLNDIREALLLKKIEDGILNKLHTANELQLKMMKSYNFRYYTEFNSNPELLVAIVRSNKLKELID